MATRLQLRVLREIYTNPFSVCVWGGGCLCHIYNVMCVFFIYWSVCTHILMRVEDCHKPITHEQYKLLFFTNIFYKHQGPWWRCLKSEIAGSSTSLAFKLQKNIMFLPRSLVQIQYCGEHPWPRDCEFVHRPPGLEIQSLCLRGSVISFISPSSRGYPVPV